MTKTPSLPNSAHEILPKTWFESQICNNCHEKLAITIWGFWPKTGYHDQKFNTTTGVLGFQKPHKEVKTHSMGIFENSIYHEVGSTYEYRHGHGVFNSVTRTDPTKCSARHIIYGFLGFLLFKYLLIFKWFLYRIGCNDSSNPFQQTDLVMCPSSIYRLRESFVDTK